MSKLLLVALAAISLYAQDKTEPVKAPTPTERNLTDTENLKLQLLAAKIQILQNKFKISDYQAELAPLVAEQDQVAMAACRSVGIPEDVIRTQCGFNLGVGPDGKALLSDGKPVQARVWWEQPKLAPTPQKK